MQQQLQFRAAQSSKSDSSDKLEQSSSCMSQPDQVPPCPPQKKRRCTQPKKGSQSSGSSGTTLNLGVGKPHIVKAEGLQLLAHRAVARASCTENLISRFDATTSTVTDDAVGSLGKVNNGQPCPSPDDGKNQSASLGHTAQGHLQSVLAELSSECTEHDTNNTEPQLVPLHMDEHGEQHKVTSPTSPTDHLHTAASIISTTSTSTTTTSSCESCVDTSAGAVVEPDIVLHPTVGSPHLTLDADQAEPIHLSEYQIQMEQRIDQSAQPVISAALVEQHQPQQPQLPLPPAVDVEHAVPLMPSQETSSIHRLFEAIESAEIRGPDVRDRCCSLDEIAPFANGDVPVDLQSDSWKAWSLPNDWEPSPNIVKPIVFDLKDMFSYHSDNVHTANTAMPQGAINFLVNSFKQRSYRTAFSGVDAPGTMMSAFASYLGDALLSSIEEPQHLSAIEWLAASQLELARHPNPPQCVYADIASFWKDDVRKCISQLRSAGMPLNRRTFIPLIRSKRSVNKFAPCLVHGRSCTIHAGRELWAGWPCVSHSPQGLRLLDEGKDFEHWAALMALVLKLKD